jgi:phosphocarrier protein
VNGEETKLNYVLKKGDRLEFLKESGRKGGPEPKQENGKTIIDVIVKIWGGLYARSSMEVVDFCNGYPKDIRIEKFISEEVTQNVDGKSIMQVMMLAATQGTKLRFIIEGDDEEAKKTAISLFEGLSCDDLEAMKPALQSK